MRVLIDVEGKSQYSNSVHSNFQNSACGPTTVHVILNKICHDDHFIKKKDINDLYKLLGGTKIGLFKWRMIRNLKKLLGQHWTIATCTIDEALEQLDNNNPVAMRFDTYFNGQFLTKNNYLYKYHWVPLIGYERKNDELYLIIHDNGGRNRESKVRTFLYEDQKKVLDFVKIEQKK